MTRLPALAFGLVALGAASCTLLADFDALSGDAAADDAAVHADGPVDVLVADDATDAGITDSAALDDRFCSSQSPAPSFCEDFDTTPFSLVWRPRVDDGGTLTLDEVSAASPPRSLRTTMTPPPADAGCRSTYDDHKLAIKYAVSVRIDYDLRIGDGDGGGYPSGYIALNRLTLSAGDDNGACYYYFLARPGEAELVISPAGGGPSETTPVTGAFVDGRWTHVAIEIGSEDAGAAGVTVWLDGVQVLAKTTTTASCLYGQVAAVTPGLFCISSSTSGEVETRVDNLVVRVK